MKQTPKTGMAAVSRGTIGAKCTAPKRKSYGMLIAGAVAAAVFLLFLSRSDIAIDYMKKGLKLCAHTVIPSLFPFMVISELIIVSGLGQRVGKLLAKPTRWLFGVSEGGACAFILGAICGFPIGAKTLCSMQDRGMVSHREFTRVMTFCNNPGSAFVISAVGISLFGSKQIGVMLYVCVLLSAVIVGAAGRLFFGKDNGIGDENRSQVSNNQPTGEGSGNLGSDIENIGNSMSISTFTSAIQNSAGSMLTVCAYVAFFSSFVGCLGAILESFGASQAVKALIFGFFEISGGVGMAAEIGTPTAAILLCAAACGWSGLSVHFQIITLCSHRGVSFKPYFGAKAAQGVVCAALMWLAIKLFPISEEVFSGASVSTVDNSAYSNAVFVCCVFFAAALCPMILNFICCRRVQSKKIKKSKNS